MTANNVAELVVFDFDGTSIKGSSPVQLVKYLLSKGMLDYSTVLKIMTWGACYKLNLPQNEAWVRSQVFSAFEGMPKEEADEIMRQFYQTKIVPLIQPRLDAAIKRHHDEGREVLVVSATFEPIVERAMEDHAWDHQFSTRMEVDENGNYTRNVIGAPVEGEEKLRLVTEYANNKYGEGNWELAYAYADHHSDSALLNAARVPLAVNPKRYLRQEAEEKGWTILDWNLDD